MMLPPSAQNMGYHVLHGEDGPERLDIERFSGVWARRHRVALTQAGPFTSTSLERIWPKTPLTE